MSPALEAAVRGLAIDFDGVVADSMPAQARAWSRTAEEVLGEDLPPEEVKEVRQLLLRNLFAGKAGERMFDGVPVSARHQRALRHHKDEIWKEIRNDTPLVDGTADVLPRLAERFPLAVATTAPRPYVTAVLRREGLLDLFRAVVTDADVPRPKPAPDMLREIGRRLDVELPHLAMVGDSATDARLARAAGCPFVLFVCHEGPEAIEEPAHRDLRVEGWDELAAALP